jgi:hypothetical protein
MEGILSWDVAPLFFLIKINIKVADFAKRMLNHVKT